MQKSINPYNQQVVEEFDTLDEKALQNKLECSVNAFESWKVATFSERSTLMKRVAKLLRERSDNYARVISLEMGKVLTEAREEVMKCADGCAYFADHAEAFLAQDEIETGAVKSFVTYQPTGGILAIMPWNFPFWQVFRFAAPALMAGNVGLLKHSSNVPKCSLMLEQIFREAGFPEGVFQSLLISNELVEKIIADDHVQGVALTGSEKAGSMVASLAGKHIKKTVLELGGSDPFIILDDADLEKTVKVAVKSRMQNAGQSCIAAKRFIVMQDIKDKFTELFKYEVEALKQGDQFDESVTTGPMARVDLAEELEDQLKRSVSAGARIVSGGKRSGANFQPTLIDNLNPAMPAFQEETFGPLAGIMSVGSVKEAVAVANNNRYGLGASVWGADIDRATTVALQIESGTVYVNSLMRSDSRLPFGGIKKSGYGRELSKAGIREFVNVKSISVHHF